MVVLKWGRRVDNMIWSRDLTGKIAQNRRAAPLIVVKNAVARSRLASWQRRLHRRIRSVATFLCSEVTHPATLSDRYRNEDSMDGFGRRDLDFSDLRPGQFDSAPPAGPRW